MGCGLSSSSSSSSKQPSSAVVADELTGPSLPTTVAELEERGRKWKDNIHCLERVVGADDKPVHYYAITPSPHNVLFAVGKSGSVAELRKEAEMLVRHVNRRDVARALALDADHGVLLTELCDGGLLKNTLRHITDPQQQHELIVALKASMHGHPDPHLGNLLLASVSGDASLSTARIKVCDWARPTDAAAIDTTPDSDDSGAKSTRDPRPLGGVVELVAELKAVWSAAAESARAAVAVPFAVPSRHGSFDANAFANLPGVPPLEHTEPSSPGRTDRAPHATASLDGREHDNNTVTGSFADEFRNAVTVSINGSNSGSGSEVAADTTKGPQGSSFRVPASSVRWVTLSQVLGDFRPSLYKFNRALCSVIHHHGWPLSDFHLVEGRLAYLPGITQPFPTTHPVLLGALTQSLLELGDVSLSIPAPQPSGAAYVAPPVQPSTTDVGAARPRGRLNRFQKWRLGIRTEPLELRSLPLEMARRRKQDGDRAATPQATLVAILEAIEAMPSATHAVAPDVAALQRVRAAAATDVPAQITLELAAWLMAAKHAPALAAVARELVDRNASAVELHPYSLPPFADRCLRLHEGVRSTVRSMCARAAPTVVDGATRAGALADWAGLVDAFKRNTFTVPCFGGDADVSFDGVTLGSGVVLLVSHETDSAEAVGLAAIHEFGHFARITLLGSQHPTPPVAPPPPSKRGTTTSVVAVGEAGDDVEVAVCGSRRFADLRSAASQLAVRDWDGVSAFPVLDTPPAGDPAGPCRDGDGSAVLMLAPVPTRRTVTINPTLMEAFAPTPESSDDGADATVAATTACPPQTTSTE